MINSSADLTMHTKQSSAPSCHDLTAVCSHTPEGVPRCILDCISTDGNSKRDSVAGCNMEKPRPSRLQIMLIIFGSLGHLSNGMSLAWPNVFAANLKVENNTFVGDGKGSAEKIDLVGSVMYFGLMVGFLLSGVIIPKLGRRLSAISFASVFAAGWLTVAFADTLLLIYIGRFVSGLGLSLTILSMRIYMVEISNTSIRGFVTVYLDVMKCLGNVVVAGLAVLLSWQWVAGVISAIVLLFGVVIVPFFPESPRFLLLQGRSEDAKKVMQSLRADKFNVEKEMESIKEKNKDTEQTSWRAMLLPENRRSIARISCLFVFVSFSGAEVVRVNMTRMLQDSSVSIDPSTCTFIALGVSLLGTISVSLVIDRIGRRWCLVATMTVAMAAYIVLGFHTYLTSDKTTYKSDDIEIVELGGNTSSVPYFPVERQTEGSGWQMLPLYCFIVIAFCVNSGISVIPLLLAAEYFPTSVRAQGMSITFVVTVSLTFLSLQLFSIMQNALTPAGLYWTYGLVAAAGAVYTIFFVRETNQQKIG